MSIYIDDQAAATISSLCKQLDEARAALHVQAPEGWALVKQERLDNIRKLLDYELRPSYRGRNLHDEGALIYNESLLDGRMDEIKTEFDYMKYDEEELRPAPEASPLPKEAP